MEMGKDSKIKMERADRAYDELCSVLDDVGMSVDEYMASKDGEPEMEESEPSEESEEGPGDKKKKMDLLILLDKGKMKKG